MDNVQVIENLKQLLVEHTSNTEIQIANNLTMIFQSFQNKSLKEDIDSYAEFVLLGASLFELKAKRLLPQDEEVDWLDEVELIKDKDLAFARLLQFKAFTEVGIAMAIKVKETEKEISAFKYYQTSSLSVKPEIQYELDINKFEDIAVEVFSRYKTPGCFESFESLMFPLLITFSPCSPILMFSSLLTLTIPTPSLDLE